MSRRQPQLDCSRLSPTPSPNSGRAGYHKDDAESRPQGQDAVAVAMTGRVSFDSGYDAGALAMTERMR